MILLKLFHWCILFHCGRSFTLSRIRGLCMSNKLNTFVKQSEVIHKNLSQCFLIKERIRILSSWTWKIFHAWTIQNFYSGLLKLTKLVCWVGRCVQEWWGIRKIALNLDRCKIYLAYRNTWPKKRKGSRIERNRIIRKYFRDECS